MTPSTIIDIGDCRTVLQGGRANSVQAVVCDPDYGIASNCGKGFNVGKATGSVWAGWEVDYDKDPRGFQTFSEEWGRRALAVCTPGAHLLAFGTQRTFHRLVCGIEDAGWDIRDLLVWEHNQGQCHGTHVRENGWSTRLQPAFDPIVLARKPLGKNVATLECFREWETGLLNIEGCKVDGKWPSDILRYKKGRGEAPVLTTGDPHTTPKPLELMRYLCRLVCPPGGWILDPFGGSGTTLEAGLLEGFSVWTIEQQEECRGLIEARRDRALVAIRDAAILSGLDNGR